MAIELEGRAWFSLESVLLLVHNGHAVPRVGEGRREARRRYRIATILRRFKKPLAVSFEIFDASSLMWTRTVTSSTRDSFTATAVVSSSSLASSVPFICIAEIYFPTRPHHQTILRSLLFMPHCRVPWTNPIVPNTGLGLPSLQ
ncbi:uncharacterized protein ARMOST_17802 [Armillaria ostoyae]|uniref:Uncharacterized protein n=1 Tax=Armillaria ostoyae TaxID=47428 RepID=A0A284S064_ARMOS|nr:uncharacterized protein ARMOST_17802 [Armillaria ostoyae]